MKTNNTVIRLLGISGIIGGLILLAGDLLFYYDSSSINLVLNMGNASDNRIIISGLTAIFATWFYLLALVHVYYAFNRSKSFTRNIMIGSFAAILVSYGIIHGAYIAIATSAKIAVENNLDLESTTSLAKEANNLLRLFIYPIFAILSFVFITEVWKKRTLYPRWIILFFPLIPFLFKTILVKLPAGGFWIVINGGFLNLILVLFFLASTVALWNRK